MSKGAGGSILHTAVPVEKITKLCSFETLRSILGMKAQAQAQEAIAGALRGNQHE